MSRNILIEGFGSISDEDARQAGLSLEDVVQVGLKRLDDAIDLTTVDTIFTGMNQDFTYALQDAVAAIYGDRDAYDIEVEAFYPDVQQFQEEDETSYSEAWKRGYTWRNNVLFGAIDSNEEQETVSLTVRFGDAGSNGQALLKHARRKGIHAMDFNLDDLIDRDEAYGTAEDAESDAEA